MNDVNRRPVAVGVVEDQDAILDYARVEAERSESDLLLVHAYDVPPTIVAPLLGLDLADSYRTGGQETLTRAMKHLAEGGGTRGVDCLLTRGFAPAVLQAESRRARLLVIGKDAAKPWDVRIFEGRAARHLAEHAVCPVVVVPATWTSRRDRGPVVVMVDGRSTAHGPLAHAFAEAAARHAELQVLHVVAPGAGAVAAWDAMQPLVEAWYARYPHVLGTVHVVEGDPHDQALRSARGASLLVMGRPGQRRTSALMFNSLAQEVITSASCPVVVVAADYRGPSL